MAQLILGSSSTWRFRLLAQHFNPALLPDCMAIVTAQCAPEIDEKSFGHDLRKNHEQASQLCLLVANAKCDELVNNLPEIMSRRLPHETLILLTLDQVVVCNGEIREKPDSPQTAHHYLDSYCDGHPAITHTAVVAMNLNTKKRVQAVDVAKQWFKPSLKSVVDALIAKGDVFGCAGGFLVDDDLVTPHLDKREGDEDSIIGMPIQLTRRLIREVLL